MSSGLFILLSDEKSLETCIKYGYYGFFMPPVLEDEPNTRSKYYAVLSDYACCEKGTEIFFFTERTITYGGTVIEENDDNPVFYLNGPTSPLGRKANSKRYINIDENISKETENCLTDNEGVYYFGKTRDGKDLFKAMPFIIEFDNGKELSGKQISSDELYFELGNYTYPFPSNTIQGKGMCTLTPKETEILLELMNKSKNMIEISSDNDIKISNELKTIFYRGLVENDTYINESQLEFTLLANNEKLHKIISKTLPEFSNKPFIKCRQIPLCPFRPIQFDMADICLYDESNPIANNSLPNVVIELKNDKANFRDYEQVTKYLRWIKQCIPNDFHKIRALLIAPNFTSNLSKEYLKKRHVSLEYYDNIILYSLNEEKIINL